MSLHACKENALAMGDIAPPERPTRISIRHFIWGISLLRDTVAPVSPTEPRRADAEARKKAESPRAGMGRQERRLSTPIVCATPLMVRRHVTVSTGAARGANHPSGCSLR